MNILHIIPNLPFINSNSVVGGSARSMWTLVQKQAEYHKVSIITNLIQLLDEPARNTNLNIDIIDLGIEVPRSTKAFGIYFLLRLLLHKELRNPDNDILHIHSGFLDYLPIALAISFLVNKPIIYSIYCPAMESRITRYSIHLLKAFKFPRLLLSAISQNTYNYLAEQGIPQNKLVIVPPPLNIKQFQEEKIDQIDAREILGLPIDRRIMLFVGNYRPEKNLIGLLNSMEKIRKKYNNALLIVTTELNNKGDKKAKLEVDLLIQEKKLAENVLILGIIDNMPALMCAADICVFPFFHTQGPSDYFLAALESMALARPVIVSAIGGMKEVITEKEEGILINPHSVEDLSNAVVELFDDPEIRELIGRNGEKRVQEMFDVEVVVEIIEGIYRKMEIYTNE